MFFRKLVAILLLGLYGVPAALGPYWHVHSCAGHSCADHVCVDLHTASDASPACSHAVSSCTAVSKCGHDACTIKHEKRHACSLTHVLNKAQKPIAIDATSPGHDGPCSICAFYANAQLASSDALFVGCEQPVAAVIAADATLPNLASIPSKARGPPVA